jgi:hypothetical protein
MKERVEPTYEARLYAPYPLLPQIPIPLKIEALL